MFETQIDPCLKHRFNRFVQLIVAMVIKMIEDKIMEQISLPIVFPIVVLKY